MCVLIGARGIYNRVLTAPVPSALHSLLFAPHDDDKALFYSARENERIREESAVKVTEMMMMTTQKLTDETVFATSNSQAK